MPSPLATYTARLTSSLSHTASRYTPQDYIRLVVIIGAYCLLRPYLLALGAKFQAKDHERELDPDELSSPAARKAVDTLRGVRDQVPDDTDSEEEDGKGADWGRGARRKQRVMVRRLLEEAERHRLEEEGGADGEEDGDIVEFLED